MIPLAILLIAVLAGIGALTARPHPWWSPDQSHTRQVFDFGHDHPALTTAAEWVGHVTVPTVLRVLTLIIAITLWYRGRRKDAVWAAAVMIIGGGIAIVLREIIARPRPRFPESGPPVEGYTFPSGHATSAALFAGMLLILFGFTTIRVLAALAFTVLVGFSRLLLGVHSIGDVTAAWVLAAALLLLAARTRTWPGAPPSR